MSFFEYLNFLFGNPFSMIGLAPETFICGALFSIPLIWTVLKIFVNERPDTEAPPVNHSPSNHTQKAA
jgi:hypothetical protein